MYEEREEKDERTKNLERFLMVSKISPSQRVAGGSLANEQAHGPAAAKGATVASTRNTAATNNLTTVHFNILPLASGVGNMQFRARQP